MSGWELLPPRLAILVQVKTHRPTNGRNPAALVLVPRAAGLSAKDFRERAAKKQPGQTRSSALRIGIVPANFDLPLPGRRRGDLWSPVNVDRPAAFEYIVPYISV